MRRWAADRTRVLMLVQVPAIDAEFGDPLGVRRLRPGLAGLDAGIFGESELNHGFHRSLLSGLNFWFRKGGQSAFLHSYINEVIRGYSDKKRLQNAHKIT